MTGQPPDEWQRYVDKQVAFLRELLTEQIRALEKYLAAAVENRHEAAVALVAGVKDSMIAAATALEQWKAITNEFRGSLDDFATRAATVQQLDERVNPLRERMDKVERSVLSAPTAEQVDIKVGQVATNVYKLETVAATFVTHDKLETKMSAVIKDVDSLKLTASQQTGRAGGIQWMIGFISFLVVLAGFALGYLALKPRP
jgi:capsule polysaccharide export protein KpsE/RkpR